nr:immunoglobulin heavy chain junction region [Macaca mulatta]MOW21695.1 immunoglobulin heavy chain junction region [Macaca mulatta]MOW22118.1 immunoglobulin heavy chain junction region [Macaca mulatta]
CARRGYSGSFDVW